MKKVFGALLAVGLAAGAANAAQIGVEWNPSTSATAQDAVIPAGGAGQWDMVASLIGGETLSVVAFEYSAIAGDPISMTGTASSSVSDFVATQGPGVLGGSGVQSASGSANPSAGSLSGPGNFVLGTYDMTVDGGAALGDVDIFINPAAGAGTLILQGSGAAFTFAPNLAGTVANFYEYGIGVPDIADVGLGGQTANPLRLEVTPEPSSLVLLALGGIAMLRRR